MDTNPIYKFYNELEFRDYTEIILRRKKVIISVFIFAIVCAKIYNSTATPIYSATTQIHIEEEERQKIPSLREIYEMKSPSAAYYETQYLMLKSRALAERVVDRLNLKASPGFQGRNPAGKLLGMVTIEPVRKSRLVDITAQSKNPKMAAAIADGFADEYIAKIIEDRLKSGQHALGWLWEEIDTMKNKVADSEKQLQEYKEQHQLVSLEESQNIVIQKLSQLSRAATDSKSARLSAESKSRQIQELKNKSLSLELLPIIRDNNFIMTLKSKHAEKEGTLSELLKRYKEKHPRIVEIKSEMATLQERIGREINKVVDSVTTEFDEAKSNEGAILKALAEQETKALELNRLSIEYKALQRESETSRQMYQSLLAKVKETDISARMEQSYVKIVDRAQVPKRPIKPQKGRNMLFACIGGLALGIFFAFMLEYFDDSLKSQKDIEAYLQLPFLGYIPAIKGRGVEVATYSSVYPRSEVGECLRNIKTNITFSMNTAMPYALLVTSAIPGEGKTSALVNLGTVLAEGGQPVLLIDADMRHPSVHKAFKLDNAKGLKDYLSNKHDLDSLIQRTSVANLDILPSGPIAFNPIELLNSENMQRLLKEAKARFTKVLIDSPPLVAVSDALIIARFVEGVVQVVKGRDVSRNTALEASKKLENIDAKIIGVILNNIDMVKEKYYYSYYSYGEKSKKKKKQKRKVTETPAVEVAEEKPVSVSKAEEEKPEEEKPKKEKPERRSLLSSIIPLRPKRKKAKAEKEEAAEEAPPEEEAKPSIEISQPGEEPEGEGTPLEQGITEGAGGIEVMPLEREEAVEEAPPEEEPKPSIEISQPGEELKEEGTPLEQGIAEGAGGIEVMPLEKEKAAEEAPVEEEPKQPIEISQFEEAPKEEGPPPEQGITEGAGGVEVMPLEREEAAEEAPPEEDKTKRRSLLSSIIPRRPKRKKAKAEKEEAAEDAPPEEEAKPSVEISQPGEEPEGEGPPPEQGITEGAAGVESAPSEEDIAPVETIEVGEKTEKKKWSFGNIFRGKRGRKTEEKVKDVEPSEAAEQDMEVQSEELEGPKPEAGKLKRVGSVNAYGLKKKVGKERAGSESAESSGIEVQEPEGISIAGEEEKAEPQETAPEASAEERQASEITTGEEEATAEEEAAEEQIEAQEEGKEATVAEGAAGKKGAKKKKTKAQKQKKPHKKTGKKRGRSRRKPRQKV